MDVYLTQEARKYLEALSLISQKCDGWLLGHIRGHRYIIEKVFAAPERCSVSLEKLIELDKKFEHDLVGFFAFEPDEEQINVIKTPFAVGKVFLDIKCDPAGELIITPFRIEYETDFILTSLQIIPKD